MTTQLKTLISFDPTNVLKGVTLCDVVTTAKKRTYVKVVNAGEYAGIQGSPQGQGFYVNPENILVPNGSLSDFSKIKKSLADLQVELKTVDDTLAERIADAKAEAETQKNELIAAFKASLQPAAEAAPAEQPPNAG